MNIEQTYEGAEADATHKITLKISNSVRHLLRRTEWPQYKHRIQATKAEHANVETEQLLSPGNRAGVM